MNARLSPALALLSVLGGLAAALRVRRQRLAHCCLAQQKHQQQRNYHFRLLMSFTKKMPQLTSAELIKFTKQMTTIGAKCCQLSPDKLLPCAEENVSIFLLCLGPTFSWNSATSSAASRVVELGVKVNEKNAHWAFDLAWRCIPRPVVSVTQHRCS